MPVDATNSLFAYKLHMSINPRGLWHLGRPYEMTEQRTLRVKCGVQFEWRLLLDWNEVATLDEVPVKVCTLCLEVLQNENTLKILKGES